MKNNEELLILLNHPLKYEHSNAILSAFLIGHLKICRPLIGPKFFSVLSLVEACSG